jgi:hypothetical protein
MKENSLIEKMGAWVLRPRVVHRLPGRLRLRIPALKRLARGPGPAAFSWRDLRIGPNRIREIQVNLTTGGVLIRYPEDELTEAELLGFLEAVSRLLLRHWAQVMSVPGERRADVLKRVAQAVGGATRSRLALNQDIEIPDDVWS